MHLLLSLPAVVPPKSGDWVGLLPELVVAAAFILVLLLDLVIPASQRRWLAVVTSLALVGSMVATVWAWFDAALPRSLYFGTFSDDRFSLFINGIILGSALLTVMISPGYLIKRQLHCGEYYSLILGATTGMMLLAGATSLILIFLVVELLSIALYILSGLSRNEERSQEAAVKYLLLGGFASGFLLYGMALIYGETGHTQLPQIFAAVHSAVGVDPLLIVGIVLLFVGFAFKVSAAPFHFWTPDVYQGAPTSVTTFMSVATKVAAFAVTVRVFTYTLPDLHARWGALVAIIAIISMVVGNIGALKQQSIKRMLAYSGIAQAGYILIGVVAPDPLGTVAVLYYLAAYAVTNIGAFAVVTIMSGQGEDLDSYDSLRGLAARRPYVAGALGLFLLSLAGFPPTAGFFGKFFVFSAAVKSGQTLLVLWGIVTSAISVYYYLRIVLLMYGKPKEGAPVYPWSRTSLAGGSVIAVTAAGTLVFGIFVMLLWNIAVAAQQGVLPGS